MTYRERERETIRRLREDLEKRQAAERTDRARRALIDAPGVQPDENAEVLFELICL